ncbi:MAG: hypothetical protein LIO67_01735 [Lachnospiraceae bacterium]|nr:hypothetical protein [Lachnospiraceae bacterium]
MTMFTHSLGVIIVVAVIFACAKKLHICTELALLSAAVGAVIAHLILPMGADARSALPFTEIVRHLVEGTFNYFDVCLTFLSATFFMTLLKESGGVNYLVRQIVARFYKKRIFCLLLLMVVMLIPGAVTGSGATTVLTVGGLVGAVLAAMGVEEDRRVALVYILAAMSAAMPPINLWTMMAAAGANMPYVGFTAPLAILSLAGALFATFFLTRGTKSDGEVDEILATLPEAQDGWSLPRTFIPFIVMIALILGARIIPAYWPVIGLPMIFMISAAFVLLCSPVKIPIFQTAVTTVRNLKELIGIMIVVGVLNQILTLTGARGLISLAVVILPISLLFATLWIILPVSEGILQYAVAPLLGVPLIMLFNMLGYNAVIALATWSVMWPVGDCLPPTAVVGRAAVMELDYKGNYYKGFVKTALIPMLFILALCTLAMVFNNQLGNFLGV